MVARLRIPVLLGSIAGLCLAAAPALGQVAATPTKFAPPVQPPLPTARPASTPATPGAPILESETSDIAKLPPAGPHRLFVATRGGGITILNGDTAKIEGTVNAVGAAGFAVAPDNSRFYVSETIWTRQNRGIRQDLLSIYDGNSLKLLTEVNLPGRLTPRAACPISTSRRAARAASSSTCSPRHRSLSST